MNISPLMISYKMEFEDFVSIQCQCDNVLQSKWRLHMSNIFLCFQELGGGKINTQMGAY